MARQRSTQPTEVELKILQALWEQEPSTVREIHNQLTPERDAAYATTVKMLMVMLDKKLVACDESVRPKVYRALVTQKNARLGMRDDMVRRVYEGSAKSLVMQLLTSRKTGKEDREEIRRLLDKLERSES